MIIDIIATFTMVLVITGHIAKTIKTARNSSLGVETIALWAVLLLDSAVLLAIWG